MLGLVSSGVPANPAVTTLGLGLGTVTAPSLYFVGDTNTGMWSSAADTVDFSAGGARVMRLSAGGADFWDWIGGSGGVTVYGGGSSTNISLNYVTKGSQSHNFTTGGSSGNIQFKVLHAATPVNFLQASGAATGSSPYLQATGSDSNVGFVFYTKGTSPFSFITNSAQEQFRVTHTANAVNYANVTGSATTNAVVYGVAGSDSNIQLNLTPKGTGAVIATSALLSTSATGGVGYTTGAGGTVTQATSRTTGVTINKVCGAITLVSAAGSTTIQAFTVTNSTVAATDTINVVQKSGTDKYRIYVTAVGAGSFEISYATLSGTTVEQPVFNFSVIKAVTA